MEGVWARCLQASSFRSAHQVIAFAELPQEVHLALDTCRMEVMLRELPASSRAPPV